MEKEMLEAAREAHQEKAHIIATNISSVPGSERGQPLSNLLGKRKMDDDENEAQRKERETIRH